MEINKIYKERFCKNMAVACLLYNHDDKHPVLIQITNSFKRMFPDKIKELEHYMFFTDFGKLEEEYLIFEDFYDSLIK